jgi:Tol biopolymer transport system component
MGGYCRFALIAALSGCSSEHPNPAAVRDGGGAATSSNGYVDASSGGASGGRGGSGVTASGGSAGSAGRGGSGGHADGGSTSVSPPEPDASVGQPDATMTPDARALDGSVADAGPAPPGTVRIGRWLAYAIGRLSLLDVSAFPLPAPIPVPDNGGAPTWSPDGRYMGYSASDDRGLVLDLSGRSVGVPTNVAATGPSGPLTFVWAPDSRTLATDRAGSVSILDPSDPAPTPRVVDTKVLRLGWLPDSSGIAYVATRAGGTDVMFARTVQFAVASSQLIRNFADAYFAFAVSPARNEFAYALGDGIELVRVSGGTPQIPVSIPLGTQGAVPTSLEFTADGGWLIVHLEAAQADTNLPDKYLIDIRGTTPGTPRSIRTLLGVDNVAGIPALSPDGRWVALGTGDSRVPANGFATIDLAGGTPAGVGVTLSDGYAEFVWSPLSTSLLVLGQTVPNTAITLAQPGTPDTRQTIGTEPNLGYSFGFSPNGRAIAYTVNRALVTRTISGATLGATNSVDTNVQNLSWSPGSTRLAYTKAPDNDTHRIFYLLRMDGALASAPTPVETSAFDNYDGQFFWQP